MAALMFGIVAALIGFGVIKLAFHKLGRDLGFITMVAVVILSLLAKYLFPAEGAIQSTYILGWMVGMFGAVVFFPRGSRQQ